jgi:quercetin dioxygenase-like cupin family protein
MEVMANVTKIHLIDDLKDLAKVGGFGDQLETRFARAALESKEGALGFQRIKPGQRQPFGHKQKEQEEIHVVIAGSGRVKVDREFIDLKTLDAIRISPDVIRQFEAGPDGMDLLIFGSPAGDPAKVGGGDSITYTKFWDA